MFKWLKTTMLVLLLFAVAVAFMGVPIAEAVTAVIEVQECKASPFDALANLVAFKAIKETEGGDYKTFLAIASVITGDKSKLIDAWAAPGIAYFAHDIWAHVGRFNMRETATASRFGVGKQTGVPAYAGVG